MTTNYHENELPVSRRDFLRRTGVGLGVLGLAGVFADSGASATTQHLATPPLTRGGLENSLAAKVPHFAPKAKRVIHFFLNGGPSHIDTFDPKPALDKIAGQALPQTLKTERITGGALPSPFKFKKYGECGLEVSELFARTAEHADEIAVIRSMYAHVPNHEPSLMLMNCGDSVLARPSMGSWIMYGLGSENQNLPGFITMCPGGYPVGGVGNWKAGFLPGGFQGTYIDSKHQQVDKLIQNIRNSTHSHEAQRRQLDLLRAMNEEHRSTRDDPRLDAKIQSFELAFRMQMEATEVFETNDEPESIKEMYGTGVHARQTLIARRLLERGVRYVQLWHGASQPWDAHSNVAGNHRKLAAQIDQPIAALLTDLKRRGMLDDTLVIWGGEFGRTPVSEGGSGRDHNHYGFTVWMAGGGVRGGTTYGATDEFGFKAIENPVSVHDFHATILHLLGFDHERLTYRYAGRDFRLTDVHGHVIRDILA